MTRKNPCFRRQGKDFLLDAVRQGFGISSGEVATAYAFAEQGVAGKNYAFFFAVQADAPLGMARCVNNSQIRVNHIVILL